MGKASHFPVIGEQDRDGFCIVECTVFEGCRSYGNTLEEALGNIKEAILVCREERGETENETIFLGVRDIEIAV